ncbi:hypothetical protein O5483_25480, partial [Escherichia coli]|nr:hypothetical protein [Escherichia coli]
SVFPVINDISLSDYQFLLKLSEKATNKKISLAEILKQSEVPPALPGHRIPGGVVWTLAFAPLIGYILEMWTAGLNGMSFERAYDAVSEGQYWFISLILNIALGYLDERKLRKS